MLENIWFIAAVWMGLALIASLISIRTGISVALVEILVGVVAGNIAVGLEGGTLHVGIAGAGASAGHLHHVLQSTEWTNFLALLGSGVLTFLAGAEIDPVSLKANWRASVLIGVLSFAAPFVVVWLFAQFAFGWPLHQAQIAGIALSTTSVAVVYAVMIEGGFSDTAMGKMILAACFITDFGTVLALGTLFANYNLWLLLFIVVTLIVLWFMPRWTQAIITRLGARQVSEPEVKFIFFILSFSVDWLRLRKAKPFCRPICLALSSPAFFFATRRWFVGCAASPLLFLHRSTLSKLVYTYRFRRSGPRFW
jgi:Kef-type K+ transport system membrane component KefB